MRLIFITDSGMLCGSLKNADYINNGLEILCWIRSGNTVECNCVMYNKHNVDELMQIIKKS